MATFLDTSLIGQFSVVFTWLFVFVLVFGIAEVTNLFKNRVLHALLAVTVALIAGFSPSITLVLQGFAPWVIIMAFFILFLLMMANFMGIPTTQIVTMLGGKNATWWLLIPFFIGMAVALSSAFGQGLLEKRTGTQSIVTEDGTVMEVGETPHQESVILTLTNPKVLGMVLVLIIATFTITFLAGGPPTLS